jgi:hypothetical protein
LSTPLLTTLLHDVSPDFVPDRLSSEVVKRVILHEGTPKAIQIFAAEQHKLTHYWYWFTLSTCWVSYSGWYHISNWRALFESSRPNRKTSIMKPSEVRAFDELPDQLRVYRAHRPGERDWISYTLSPTRAAMFADKRGVSEVGLYKIQKADCIALFLRRDEFEVLMLDPTRAKSLGPVRISPMPGMPGWEGVARG